MSYIRARFYKTKESSKFNKYFEGVRLFGSKTTWREGIGILGCHAEDEKAFYQGVYDMDHDDGIIGFDSVDEVEQWWMEGGDGGVMTLQEDDLIEQPLED